MTVPIPTTSRETTWRTFEVGEGDLEFIYNLLLEREVPLTTPEMAAALVAHRLEEFEKQAQEASKDVHPAYLPANLYEVGEKLAFPRLKGRVGKVVGVRAGENPDLSPFKVIEVEFPDGSGRREFASGLQDHVLNLPPEAGENGAGVDSADGVLMEFGEVIQDGLEESLSSLDDIVKIAGRWFPSALLAEIHEGHLNLAEAVLDVAGGGPLPTKDLLEHIELEASLKPQLAAFSLDYALQEDERFDEVGPAGQVLWYLKRLEPPEVLYTPPRLEHAAFDIDRGLLSPALLDLERQLDDELSPLQPQAAGESQVSLSVLFPHWRVGTLPLSSRLRPLFPTAYEAPRIRFILVDGHSGEKFPGWVVRAERYVFGLDDWYRRYDIPAGGLIKVRGGDAPGEVVIEVADRRKRNDWVRTVSFDADGQIGFTMLKQPLGAAYDELMVVGLVDPIALDEAWMRGSQRSLPLRRLVGQVFRELAKLNPQSAVHAQSLYSAVNVIQRVPPAPIFVELLRDTDYEHVGDLYWRFKDGEAV